MLGNLFDEHALVHRPSSAAVSLSQSHTEDQCPLPLLAEVPGGRHSHLACWDHLPQVKHTVALTGLWMSQRAVAQGRPEMFVGHRGMKNSMINAKWKHWLCMGAP